MDIIEFHRANARARDAEAAAAAGPAPVPALHSWVSAGGGETQVQLAPGRYELRFVPAIEHGSIWRHDGGYSQVFYAEREPPAPTGKIDLSRLGSAIADHLKPRGGQNGIDAMAEALGLQGRLALAERLGLVVEDGPVITDATGTVLVSGNGSFELKEPAVITVQFGALPASIELFTKE